MRKSSILVAAAALTAGGMLIGPADAGDRSDRSDRGELSANQIVAQSDARSARMKADLRLTPEQEKNWSGFESALSEVGKKRADREITLRTERTDQKGPGDFIDSMRHHAASLSERSDDEKKLADAAQPLYGSLDARQKERFSRELTSSGNERAHN
jgi:LTXXQ motif family protein